MMSRLMLKSVGAWLYNEEDDSKDDDASPKKRKLETEERENSSDICYRIDQLLQWRR